jgi:DNA-binding FrmR family transcriptional regulator|tara:strand:+ start:71 stop:334 length:264 start_codon:yes stop_codon:yes gene_type:complete
MSHPDHSKNLSSLRRIEGQVRGVQQMIDDKRYCMDIVNQIKAMKSALSRVESKILEKHLRSCVTQILNKKEMEEKITELVKVFKQVK